MELQAIHIESLVGQAELRIKAGRKQTLVGKIMDRENGSGPLAGSFQQYRWN